MLTSFLTDWQAALNNRIIIAKHSIKDSTITKQHCEIKFRDTTIQTTESWEGANLTHIKTYVPSTKKFIARQYIDFNTLNWQAMAAILNALNIGSANEDKIKYRRELWIKQNHKTLVLDFVDRIKKTKQFTDDEIALFAPILEEHIKSNEIIRARTMVNVLIEYSPQLTGNDIPDGFYNYIDRLYALFVSVVDRKYYHGVTNRPTISINNCKYLFLNKIAKKIPYIYEYIRGLLSEIYYSCGISSNFVCFAEMMCVYYSAITCTPYNIKLAEVKLDARVSKERKMKYNASMQAAKTASAKFGNVGELPTAAPLNKIQLES